MKNFNKQKGFNKMAVTIWTSMAITILFFSTYMSYRGYAVIETAKCKLVYGPRYEMRFRQPVKYTQCSCREGYVGTPGKNKIKLNCETPLEICRKSDPSYKKASMELVENEVKINCE